MDVRNSILCAVDGAFPVHCAHGARLVQIDLIRDISCA